MVTTEEMTKMISPASRQGRCGRKRPWPAGFVDVSGCFSFCRPSIVSASGFVNCSDVNYLSNPLGRKIKCSGGRPMCTQCAGRCQACIYDKAPRYRGRGRKKMRDGSTEQQQQCRHSTPTISSLSTYCPRELPYPPIPSLSAPQEPKYPYKVGTIPRMEAARSGPTRAGSYDVYL